MNSGYDQEPVVPGALSGGMVNDFGLILLGMRAQSQWSIEQFLQLLHVDAAEGYLVFEKNWLADKTPEAHYLPTLIVDTRQHYQKEVRGGRLEKSRGVR